MLIMYCLASLPMIYAYSFSPKSELIGFINVFVVNVIVCFLDMVLAFMAVFSQGQPSSTSTHTHVSKIASLTENIRWVVSVLFPCVNFKRALFNIRLKSNAECVSAVNTIMFTDYSVTGPWTSLKEPGVGIQFTIFCVQMCFWWIVLTLVEKGRMIKLGCRKCCGCDNELQQVNGGDQLDNEDGTIPTAPTEWDDAVC
jgi:hypothetical protein